MPNTQAPSIYALPPGTVLSASGNSPDLQVGSYSELALDVTTTAQAGTNPTLQLFIDRKSTDGNYYTIWQSAVLTLAANVVSTSLGVGMSYNVSFGHICRLRWVLGGSAGPSYTGSVSIVGK